MPRYPNGYIPESELVIFRRGHNRLDGDWYWGLTPSSYQKHLALTRRGADRTGRWLEPSDGWGTVRPMHAQVIAREIYGNGAAWPGTSSHGGWWENRDTMAVDYSNWHWVYDGDWQTFYADCRAVGLSPGMISAERGYPEEKWHVIDLDPWAASPIAAGDTSTPFDPQEDDMPSEAWLNGLGTSIVQQIVAQTFSGKDRERLDAVYAALFGPANLNVPQMTWAKPFGEAPGAAQYGLLDVSIYSQALIAQQAGRLAAIEEVVEQLAVGAGAVLDMGAIADAAERGAERALEGLAVPTAAEVADAVNDDAADRLKG